MTRGVLWMTWGNRPDVAAILHRSRLSVAHWHPELEQHVATMPDDSTLLCKSRMCDLSPFDETLFLDADTTALGRLDYGFGMARRHGIALCINASPWQRRYYKIGSAGDAVEYSSGVVFFAKRHDAQRVFERWNDLSGEVDSRCRYAADGFTKEQLHNDQAILTLAMDVLSFNPFVLPLNFNLHPTWQRSFFGPVKVWHGYDDIPSTLLAWNEEQDKPDAVIRAAMLP